MPIDPITGAAIIGAGSQMVSGILGSSAQRRSDRRNNRANMRLAEYAYSKDLEMWNRQNQYNSPSSQMGRFKEAGLNPNLIYGQGTPGNATQLPQYQAPQYQSTPTVPVDPGPVVSQYMNTAQQHASRDLTKQQIEVQEATEVLATARAAGVWNDNTIKGLEAEISRHILERRGGSISEIADGRIAGMKADDYLKVLASQIRQWEKGLTDQNINPRDTLVARQIIDFLKTLGFAPSQINDAINNYKSNVNSFNK